MTYQQVQETNARAKRATATLYSLQTRHNAQQKLLRALGAWTLGLIVLCAYLLASSIEGHQQIKDITAQQQLQAGQHADDRMWYQDTCTPYQGSLVVCDQNSELAK